MASNFSIIEQYGHGGDIWTAEQRFGVSRRDLLDFSANINPLGPPESIWRAIRDNLTAITAYPDSQSRELKRALAERYGLPVEKIAAGNGAAEILYGVMHALQPRMVGLIHPCFSEYAEACKRVGAKVLAVYAREEQDFLPSRDELLAACEIADLFVVGYPNNPNGRLLPIQWLRDMAVRVRWLLVDEAFLDFLPGAATLLTELEKHPNVILLRSATKFYSIPGLRLGYAFAQPEITARIAQELPPWGVNSLAQAAGVAGLQDADFEKATVDWLRGERPVLQKGLEQLPGVKTYAGEVNFVLFRCEIEDLQEKMGRRGVLIRSCAAYPGLGPCFYRVAVRSREDNLRLLDGLAQIIREEVPSCRTSS